jgi:hypothetical protein
MPLDEAEDRPQIRTNNGPEEGRVLCTSKPARNGKGIAKDGRRLGFLNKKGCKTVGAGKKVVTFTRDDGDLMVLVDEVPAPHDGGWYCAICELDFDTEQDMDEHAEEMGHTHTDHGDSHGEGEEHSNDTEFDSAQGIPQFALNGEFFYLKTLFRGDDECLEGNALRQQARLGGAAFMKSGCGDSGQHFRLVPRGGGFHLKTRFRGEDECLDGNRFSNKARLGGAAFMSLCTGGRAYDPGMLWNFVPSERDGYFHLKTRYRGEDECLEGNQVSDQATLGGAAFMSPCTGQSGMLWKLVPFSGG